MKVNSDINYTIFLQESLYDSELTKLMEKRPHDESVMDDKFPMTHQNVSFARMTDMKNAHNLKAFHMHITKA